MLDQPLGVHGVTRARPRAPRIFLPVTLAATAVIALAIGVRFFPGLEEVPLFRDGEEAVPVDRAAPAPSSRDAGRSAAEPSAEQRRAMSPPAASGEGTWDFLKGSAKAKKSPAPSEGTAATTGDREARLEREDPPPAEAFRALGNERRQEEAPAPQAVTPESQTDFRERAREAPTSADRVLEDATSADARTGATPEAGAEPEAEGAREAETLAATDASRDATRSAPSAERETDAMAGRETHDFEVERDEADVSRFRDERATREAPEAPSAMEKAAREPTAAAEQKKAPPADAEPHRPAPAPSRAEPSKAPSTLAAMEAAPASPSAGQGEIISWDRSIQWRIQKPATIEGTTDGGRTWNVQVADAGAPLLGGKPLSEDVCWIVGEAGTIFRTSDGRTWERLESPTGADIVNVYPVGVDRATIEARDGRRWTTTDGGRAWKQL